MSIFMNPYVWRRRRILLLRSRSGNKIKQLVALSYVTLISHDGMVKTVGYSSRRQPVLDSASFDPHIGDAKSTNPITSLYRSQEEY